MKIWSKRHGSPKERGQALVEFVLVSLIFFTLFFGIFDCVRLLQSWVTVQHAARESARFAITGRLGCDEVSDNVYNINDRDECIEWVGKKATEGIPSGGEGADDADVNVTFKAWDYTGSGWGASATSDASGLPCDQMEVTVTYRHHFSTPIITAIIPSGVNLKGTQRMTNEPFGRCDVDDGVTAGG